MDRTTIKNQCARALGRPSRAHLDPELSDDLDVLLDRTLNELWTEYYWRFALTSATFNTVAGTASYSGTANILMERGLRKIYDDTNDLPIDIIRFDEYLDLYADTQDQSDPRKAALGPTQGNVDQASVYLHHTPGSVIAINFWYWRLPAATTADGQTLDWPARWDSVLFHRFVVRAGEQVLSPSERGVVDRYIALDKLHMDRMRKAEAMQPGIEGRYSALDAAMNLPPEPTRLGWPE